MNQNYSNFKTVRSSSAGSKAKKSALPWVLGCFGSLMVIGLLAVMGYFVFFTGSNASQSFITIREPLGNEDLQIGEMVTLRAIAKGDKRIEQVEIWVDDILISYENSDVPGGISPFPILTSWVPRQAGLHTISARSTDSSGEQSVNQITVNVLENIDSDGDSIPDHLDRCPNQPGTDVGQGCLDRDYDGVPDDVDVCPDEAGLPEDGCPAPSENDRDGDGFLDDADECPDEIGSPSARGCPDTDGDGFANSEDPCPDEAGTTEGCPTAGDTASDTIHDRDGDGVLDHEDACPDAAGSTENGGCPEMSGGVLPPPPDPEDIEEDGSSDSFLMDMGFELGPPRNLSAVPLEIAANELHITGDYEDVWCYLSIEDVVNRRIDFNASSIQRQYDTSSDHNWFIDEETNGANSIMINHEENDPLDIHLDCLGYTSDTILQQLINATVSVNNDLWDGRELYINDASPPDFTLRYEVCRGSCENVTFQAPRLAPITGGSAGEGPYRLHWQWDGRSADIEGFIVYGYRDGELFSISEYGPTIRTISLDNHISTCGHTDEFEVRAFRYEGLYLAHSPWSNRVGWPGDPCMYNAIVTFQSLDIHHPMADEGGAYEMGPVRGGFYAGDGDNSKSLWFDTMWINAFDTRSDGLWLGAGEHRILDIFNWVHREQASCLGRGCHANDYSAPESSSVHFSIEEGQSIIVGTDVFEHDTGITNAGERILQDEMRIPFDQLVLNSTERFVLEGEVANLIVTIELQEAP